MISPVSASGVSACGQQRYAAGDRARALLVDRQRHGILAEALLGHEGFGGVDQFVEVLDAVLAFPFGAVEVDQAASAATPLR